MPWWWDQRRRSRHGLPGGAPCRLLGRTEHLPLHSPTHLDVLPCICKHDCTPRSPTSSRLTLFLFMHRFVTISELACVCSTRESPMQDSCKCSHVQKAGAPSEGVPHGLVSGNQVSRPPPYIPLRRVVPVCEQKVHLEAASPAHCCP